MNDNNRTPDKFTANYIVRIYRLDKRRRDRVVGIVETVGEEVKTAFTSVDELWNILKSGKGSSERGPL